MNIFRLAGDFSHLASYLILLYVLFKKRNAVGTSTLRRRRSRETTAIRPFSSLTNNTHIHTHTHTHTRKHTSLSLLSLLLPPPPPSSSSSSLSLSLHTFYFHIDSIKKNNDHNNKTTHYLTGISLKTQQLYLLVFCCRYLDLFTSFYSLYNTLFKIFYIGAAGAICWLIMFKEPWKMTNDKIQDTFRMEFLILPCFVLALLINYDFSFMEIMWTFSIYLESVAILPQLFVLHRTQRIANFTSHYVFTLGAYRALYILNWIYRFFTEYYYRQYIVWIAGVVQTALYCDFFLHYIKAKKQGFDKDVLLPTSTGKQ